MAHRKFSSHEEWLAHRKEYKRNYEKKYRTLIKRERRLSLRNIVLPQEPPDPRVFAERDRALSPTMRLLIAIVVGDPLPGRSALDRRA